MHYSSSSLIIMFAPLAKPTLGKSSNILQLPFKFHLECLSKIDCSTTFLTYKLPGDPSIPLEPHITPIYSLPCASTVSLDQLFHIAPFALYIPVVDIPILTGSASFLKFVLHDKVSLFTKGFLSTFIIRNVIVSRNWTSGAIQGKVQLPLPFSAVFLTPAIHQRISLYATLSFLLPVRDKGK